jgi:hypothetical protein
VELFGFIPEPVFTFIPETCSRSSRNTVRNYPGIAFILPRNPHFGRRRSFSARAGLIIYYVLADQMVRQVLIVTSSVLRRKPNLISPARATSCTLAGSSLCSVNRFFWPRGVPSL